MKVKLYLNVHEDMDESDLKCLEIEIVGKTIHYYVTPDSLEDFYDGSYEFSKRFFTYEKDNRYKGVFTKLKLNFHLSIHKSSLEWKSDGDFVDESYIGGKEGYVYLNLWQRVKLDWAFEKTWIQKAENIKWLISIPISILTTLITQYFTSK